MFTPNFPDSIPPFALKNFLQPLSLWASSTSAEADLESIFGSHLDWATACKPIAAFRCSDFFRHPTIHTHCTTY